jgi:hypothetical protein
LILSTNEDRKKAPKIHLQNVKFTLAAFRMNVKSYIIFKKHYFMIRSSSRGMLFIDHMIRLGFYFQTKVKNGFNTPFSNAAEFSSFEVFIYSFFCSNICTEGGMNLFHCGLKNIYRLVNIHFSGEKNVDSFR